VAVILAFVEATIILVAVAAEGLLAGRAQTESARLLVEGVILALSGLAAFHFNDLYDLRRLRRFGQFAARLPQSLVCMVVLASLAHLVVPGLEIGWRTLAEVLLLSLALILPLRLAVHHLFSRHPFSRRVLVLGTTELAGKLIREFLDEPHLRDVLVGVVDDGSAACQPEPRCLRLGSIDKLGKLIEGFEPDLIVDALREPHDPRVVRELVTPAARGVCIEDGVTAYERLTGKIAIEWATPRDVLFSKELEVSWLAVAWARAFSLVVALCAVVLLAPFFLLVAILIKLDSAGPIFFLQARVGLGGRSFDLIKFRTMHPGVAVSEWAADNVHRNTRVGRWLRRFRIDELPQFLNILQGDMNLVGPRPHPVSNLALFNAQIPYYGMRCSVRPGVTGWAQIRYGYANDLQEETEKMRYDLHYIQHMSIALDLQILFETLKVVLTGGRSAVVEEPGIQVSPIYFGIEARGGTRRAARASAPPVLHRAPAPPLAGRVPPLGPKDGAVPFEEHRDKGPRAPSRGVA
jgi:exopolysaccharide biosynthesis polyprenyl glycosylphosphotransferase